MAVATHSLRQAFDEVLPGVVADRRFLHEHPELAFEERETARFVAERLEALGVEDIRTGINVTGVTGLIRGSKGDGPCVLVRADMDALPLHDEKEVDYRSKVDGVMHACGHDAHTAMLLGVARVLMDRRNEFAGTVKLLFQPAEEVPPGGAKGMIEAGVLEDPHVDTVFGLHVLSDVPAGIIEVSAGPIMAASDRVEVHVQGRGGHGANPNLAVDPVIIGTEIVSALQTIVSREVDPIDSALISICAFYAGKAFNVIPDTAMLGGTVRTYRPETRDLLERRITEIATGIAASMGGSARVDFERGYPATVNEPAMTELMREAARDIVGEERVRETVPVMGGEDFAYFLEERPGAFFYVGTGNEAKDAHWQHHHPRFDIDEDPMADGMAVMAATVLRALAREDTA